MHEMLNKIILYLIRISGIIVGATMLWGAITYASHIHLFTQSEIKITGTSFISDEQVLDLMNLEFGNSLLRYDLKELQTTIESLDYVRACKVSHVLPFTIFIEIVESEPMVMVELDDNQFFFDSDFVPLPVNGHALNFFPVPILSFENANPVSKNDFELERALKFIKNIQKTYNSLYENTSELRYVEKQVILITDSRTRIELGSENVIHSLNILKNFERTVKQKRTLDDYSRINLKVKNQIIVRERHNSGRSL